MGPSLMASPAAEPVTVSIRDARDSERKFVEGTWSRSFVFRDRQRCSGPKPHRVEAIERAIDIGRKVDSGAVALDVALLVRAHHRLVDEILSGSDVRIAVACLPDVPNSPVAWACWAGPVLHFVYTVPVARRCTIGRQLVLHSRCSSASHSTTDGLALMRYLHGSQ